MAMPAEEVGETNSAGLEQRRLTLVQDLPREFAESDILSQVEVLGIREGGLVECYVPFSLIDNEEVPVKKEWASSLARQMGEIAESEGGTGQHMPVTLGLIQGEETLKIMDGFHRSAALRMRGEDYVYATVKLTDWNDLYDFRIFTAKDHAHVRFSRVVQWIREVWDYSGLEDKLSVEQAVLLYRYDSDGSKLGLEPADVASAKAWVAHKEAGWEIAAMTIHSYLKIAETVDPKLVHTTREKTRNAILEGPTQIILKILSTELPNNFEMQNVVMETAKRAKFPNSKGGTRSPTGPEVRAMCQHIKGCLNADHAETVLRRIDWKTWEPTFAETKTRALRQAHDPRNKGAAALSKSIKEVAEIRERVKQSREREEKITDEQKQNVREARQQAKDLMGELGTLIFELYDLTGEKPPAVRPQPSVSQQPKTEAQQAVAREFEEHEGLADLIQNGNSEGRVKPATIQEAVFRCLKGEIEIDDVPYLRTRGELRHLRSALSQATDIEDEQRAPDWVERFKDLQAMADPRLARALGRS